MFFRSVVLWNTRSEILSLLLPILIPPTLPPFPIQCAWYQRDEITKVLGCSSNLFTPFLSRYQSSPFFPRPTLSEKNSPSALRDDIPGMTTQRVAISHLRPLLPFQGDFPCCSSKSHDPLHRPSSHRRRDTRKSIQRYRLFNGRTVCAFH